MLADTVNAPSITKSEDDLTASSKQRLLFIFLEFLVLIVINVAVFIQYCAVRGRAVTRDVYRNPVFNRSRG